MLPYTTVRDLGSGNLLFVVDIETIDAPLKDLIDKKFVKICEGNSGTNLALVKERLINFLNPKIGSNLEIGAIAEFFLHLFLQDAGFEPQFLFLNLEEGSIKKGFDGYYEYNGEEWVMESKSGSVSTANMSHGGKIREAYTDLAAKFSGNVTNNPWQNAYNHANMIDVGASPNIRANIKKFSDEFLKGIFYRIKDFNIIPGSTIVLDGLWVKTDADQLEIEVKGIIQTLHYKQIKVLCITQKSLDLFWDYLTQP